MLSYFVLEERISHHLTLGILGIVMGVIGHRLMLYLLPSNMVSWFVVCCTLVLLYI